VEAFTQFFIGAFDTDMTYIDDLRRIVRRNLLSLSGFWFDCVTSIPWSYVDVSFYLVMIIGCVASQRGGSGRARRDRSAAPSALIWSSSAGLQIARGQHYYELDHGK
jgi:hypothetical protein